MQTTINGKAYHFPALPPDESAVHLLRERCGLTGTKLVCGAGVCGACTVRLDGVPVTSCLLPATHLADRAVETIEAHGPDNLHPMQFAFMAHDALQCGFCTPGFLNSAIAFYEQWRAERGRATPTRDEVAAALAGHLCRCGAYPGIYEAVQRACAGEFDEATEPQGARVDALPKVTGQAQYTVDVHYEGQLVGKLLRSPYAHAELRAVDLTPAQSLPGVRAVIRLMEPGERVRYVGQELAAVAAVDEAAARAALAAIRVEYHPLPAVTDQAQALAPDAPLVWPDNPGAAPNAAEGPIMPGKWEGNLRRPRMNLVSQKPGQAHQAIQAAQAEGLPLVQGEWRTPAQIHTALEPHACVARWEGADRLTVHLSTQSCDPMAHELAAHFDLPVEQVTVLCPYIGGAFGAKLGLTTEAIAAVHLARLAQAPVGLLLERPEEMTVGGYRPSARVELALAAGKEGQLKGLSVQAYADSGIGINSMIAAPVRLLYGSAPRDLADLDVVTHVAPGRPFRGPGGPVTCWALEQAVDQVAHELGRDPIELRHQWQPDPLRARVYDWVAALPAWRERGPTASGAGRFRRGIGVATGSWAYFYDSESEVQVSSGASGLVVRTASQDMGNGTRSVLAQAVAEAFGISPLAVTVELGSSQAVHGPRSGGSRTTNSLFAPAHEAACTLRDRLLMSALERLALQEARPVPGGIAHREGTLAWAEALAQLPPQEARASRGTDGRWLDRVERWVLPHLGADFVMGQGMTSAAFVSEVEVDTLLGQTRVRRVWSVLAAGKIHVPALARSQVHGGVIQGIGYALYEEKVLDPHTGAVLTLGLEDYRLPGIGDIPEIEVDFIEEGFEHAKGQGVGLSELATLPVAASIGNAIFHATGWRPTVAPVRPDRLLQGVHG